MLSTTAQSTDLTGQEQQRGEHTRILSDGSMDWHQCDQRPLPTKLHTGHCATGHRGRLQTAAKLHISYFICGKGHPTVLLHLTSSLVKNLLFFRFSFVTSTTPQANLTAKSLHCFHAITLSVCTCNNFSLAENLIKNQLQDISHYHKQISFKESNMLIHSTADNSKEIQMKDYPLASFPPRQVFKKQILKLFTAELWGV